MTNQEKAVQVKISDIIKMGGTIRSVFYIDINHVVIVDTKRSSNIPNSVLVTTAYYTYSVIGEMMIMDDCNVHLIDKNR